MAKHSMMFAIAVLLIAADSKDDTAPAKRSTVQGRWVSIWSNVGGKSCKIDKGNVLVFKGDSLSWTFKKGVDPIVLRFSLDPTATSIDIFTADVKENEPARGLYRLKGDTLVLCIAQTGKPRPKEINSGNEMLMYVLVRDNVKENDVGR